MTDGHLDPPQGTLDLLILKALSLVAMHGWAVSERIHQVSRATLQIPQDRCIRRCIVSNAAAG